MVTGDRMAEHLRGSDPLRSYIEEEEHMEHFEHM